MIQFILISVFTFWVGFYIGKKNGKNEKFGVAGNDNGIKYSFESGKTFDETLEKITEVVKENNHLKQQIKVLTYPL